MQLCLFVPWQKLARGARTAVGLVLEALQGLRLGVGLHVRLQQREAAAAGGSVALISDRCIQNWLNTMACRMGRDRWLGTASLIAALGASTTG